MNGTVPHDGTRAAYATHIDHVLARAAAELRTHVRVREEGVVTSVADGIVRVSGLPTVGSEELLEIGARATAMVLDVERASVQAIALHHSGGIHVGSPVRATGRRPTVAVGEGLLGRVIDPTGRPIDGRPPPGTLRPSALERAAPRIYERASVHTPLNTGVLAIDAMFPIGRGQRELLIGDEGTGKTALALDIMLRQKTTDVVSVYVAVGRRRSETWRLVETLRQFGGRWVVVFAAEEESPGLRMLAPFAGMTVAEYFRDRGEHALVIFDDLTAHAVAWRELSLLLRRPPGREAYPGDIFYLHSRLLERAAQLSRECGGGSVTALPLAALEGGRLSSYIPTNLISITDGQIVLSRDLFSSGQKPAIDAGLSVSRVGAKAQPDALRDLSARMRLDYAAFLELESFSRLGTRLGPATERRLALGRRVRHLLRAQRLAPLALFDEVLLLSLANDSERLLRIAEDQLQERAIELLRRARTELPELNGRVDRDAVLTEADRRALSRLLDATIAAPAKGDSSASRS